MPHRSAQSRTGSGCFGLDRSEQDLTEMRYVRFHENRFQIDLIYEPSAVPPTRLFCRKLRTICYPRPIARVRPMRGSNARIESFALARWSFHGHGALASTGNLYQDASATYPRFESSICGRGPYGVGQSAARRNDSGPCESDPELTGRHVTTQQTMRFHMVS